MKMFRLFFVLALAFFLSSFVISQKKSPNEVNLIFAVFLYFYHLGQFESLQS